MKKYYFGGYPSDHNNGIYQSDELFLNYRKIVDASSTTYFDVQDVIATILKEGESGGIGVFDLEGNCLDKKCSPLKPGCFIVKKENLIYVTHYHEGMCLIYEWNKQELSLKKQLMLGNDAKCHEVIFDSASNTFGVICLGLDKIIFFNDLFEAVDEIVFPKGSGPRHALFNEDESLLFILSELSRELFVYDRHKKQMIQRISLLEQDTEGTGAAIRLSEDGTHLYTSVRYADVITHFEWNEGQWQPKQYYSCNKTPRDFLISGNKLIVCYQDGGCVEMIDLDEKGNLIQVIHSLPLEKMVCVKEA